MDSFIIPFPILLKLAASQPQMMLKFLFYFSFLIIFYSYIGYGIILYISIKIKRLFRSPVSNNQLTDFEPEVTMVVPVYNEADFIDLKIKNCMELNYPSGKLRWIFITDGSTDDSPDIIGRNDKILLLHQPERKGKASAINRVIKYVETPYVIFSDANTLINPDAVKEIVKHYENPRVGGVSGEKIIISKEKDKASGAGEGIYWKYESLLKKLDSEFYTVVGAAGELFSIKTELFHIAAEDTIIEDFVLSLQICMAGYVIRYEPKAFAIENASVSIKEEQKRKVRIAAGGFQAMQILKKLFNVFNYPVLSFQFISHRVLRWTLSPVCLIMGLLSNILLVYSRAGRFFWVFLLIQMVFYALALTGWLFANRNIRVKTLYIPYYFLFMNLSLFLGYHRYLKKKQPVIWEKAARYSPPDEKGRT